MASLAPSEVLWVARGDFKKVIHHANASGVARLWRESPRQGYGSSAPVKVVRKWSWRCAPGFLLTAPPLTVLVEPGTWRLGIRAGICGQGGEDYDLTITSGLTTSCNTQ